MGPEVAYSVQILLPAALQRQFERWTDETEGASWPAQGGHVTLLPPFHTALTREDVLENVADVCRRTKTFTLCLDVPKAVLDLTRPDYFAVFLSAAEEWETGFAEAATLRSALADYVAAQRNDVLPELSAAPFLPHITLALGVSEREARRVARACVMSALEAKFVVEAVTLLETPRDKGAGKPWQADVSLARSIEN